MSVLFQIPGGSAVSINDPEVVAENLRLLDSIDESLVRLVQRGAGDREIVAAIKYRVIQFMGWQDQVSISTLASNGDLDQDQRQFLYMVLARVLQFYRTFFSSGYQAVMPGPTAFDAHLNLTAVEEASILGIFLTGMSEEGKNLVASVMESPLEKYGWMALAGLGLVLAIKLT